MTRNSHTKKQQDLSIHKELGALMGVEWKCILVLQNIQRASPQNVRSRAYKCYHSIENKTPKCIRDLVMPVINILN